ncbi:hypothetical protein [Streptomyces malaysiensis]|uniref:hypothetical protein n=1 Tax=Streptomyces malaysiensis TaxID=92644 RepID=UPI0036C2BA47
MVEFPSLDFLRERAIRGGRSRLPEPTVEAGAGTSGDEGVLALVLGAITLLVFAGCSVHMAVTAVAAGALITAELKQHLP